MPRPYICLKKSMETQEQKFTRELADSRMQIELLRNQVLLRYYAQLLELDIMQHPKEVKTLMSSINTLERYARKYTPKGSAKATPAPNETQPMTNEKETATNTVPHEGEKIEIIEPKKIQNRKTHPTYAGRTATPLISDKFPRRNKDKESCPSK